MLFISHDLAVVRSLADRVAVLFHGRLCEVGGVDEIFEPPFHPYTYSLLMAVPGVQRGPKSGAETEALLAPHEGLGCAFAGRCPWQAGKLCEETPPPWRETGGGLRIRCHLTTDDLSARASWPGEAATPAPDAPPASLGVQDP
jgi:peptide/nickel transport system ATP-binding protein